MKPGPVLLGVAALLIVAYASSPGEPRLFAEGVVSTPGDEYGTALTPDGNAAFFGKASATTTGVPLQVICMTHLEHGQWSSPGIAPFSGKFRDMGPALSPDGARLFFISNRPVGNGEAKDMNIWVVDRKENGWGEPRSLDAPVNSESQEYGVSVAANGTLYFASNRKGGKGSFDLYRSRFENGRYQDPENLGEAINTEGPEAEPAISPDESTLVFVALGRDDELVGVHKEYNHGDLYVSFRHNGVWSPARNCGPGINSGAQEAWPAFAENGKRLLFSSERGFATQRPARALTWAELERGLRSTLNGMGNIYEVDRGDARHRSALIPDDSIGHDLRLLGIASDRCGLQ